ncbi:hypothetical protein PCASD_06120 [Puccinia coronata f. sp. avenae]|uniref:Pectate lyase n=1 Tax=Puccinia coronata f. sp. avenae TaxID=200324 RepID=A0A2N5V099_9BASI|nr:hypothetical protein PCASD_06120 [Puccinia coronata f. sp. avenae]
MILTVHLALTMTLEAQNFPCTTTKPNGICGKGKTFRGTFKRVVLASDEGRDAQRNKLFACHPSHGEIQVIGVNDLRTCQRA